MSSPTISVSVCVICIEISNVATEKSEIDIAIVKKMRGFREPKQITIESHFNKLHEPFPLLSSICFNETYNVQQSKPNEIYNVQQSKPTKILELNTVECNTPSLLQEQTNTLFHEPFIETEKGIFHLFKENELTEMHCAADRSHTVCMLSVPTIMSYENILTFTAAFHRDIQYFRILRDSNPNQYMMLITFLTSTAASEFYKTFNGVPYGCIAPDIACHLVFLSKVEMTDNGLPLTGHTELPSCSVCLERMDESVDGILNTMCNHSFQSYFLYEEDTFCPICRCAQSTESLSEKCCMECVTKASNEDLWICLICGHLGCSRYDSGHAFEHYHDTHHCYAMQLGNNRVWDYVRDNFVHRLLQNKDGKIVDSSQESAKSEGTAVDEKIDSVQLEFTYLLTSQLETQRKYFEEKLSRLEQHVTTESSDLRTKLYQISQKNSQMQEQVTKANREKQALEKKLHNSNNKLSQIQKELVEERELRKALNANQTAWQLKHKDLQDSFAECKQDNESVITVLQNQVKRLMCHLESQKQTEILSEKEEAVPHINESSLEKENVNHIAVKTKITSKNSKSMKNRKKHNK